MSSERTSAGDEQRVLLPCRASASSAPFDDVDGEIPRRTPQRPANREGLGGERGMERELNGVSRRSRRAQGRLGDAEKMTVIFGARGGGRGRW